ncbi:CPBP family intramembrane glutamic endopeptidase [Clostridium ganghwense]|uniref:Type II CAAX endopeptidase family protein n=1 Tax=Clostridium ganghwense TaxID=312089 RepID=A0ABT4CQ46_9CLOT|nr:type II CAAX endopeptidase family protein [Clostridium ganghwense]MCY6371170.1 type II CAAX endopeptidase family protein [Clostridium ganghwense]
MNDFFQSIKIRKAVFVYLLVTISLMIISEQPYFKKFEMLDFNFWLMINRVILILWIIYITFKNNIRLKPIIKDFKDKVKWSKITKIICMNFAFSISFVVLVVSLAYMISPEFFNKLLAEVSEDNNTFSSEIFTFIAAVFLAPIVEEFIFRGIILNRLRMTRSTGTAIIISSILFGLMHGELAFLGAFVFGIIMCLVYIKTENLMNTISIHFFNNLIAESSSFFPSTSSNVGSISKSQITIGISVGLIIFLISGFFCLRYIKENWQK